MLKPNLSIQLAIASERAETYPYIVNPTGTFTTVPPVSFRIYPVDLTVRYHFLNDTRWKPYIGAGAHYEAAPHVGPEFRYQNHLGPLLVGGTAFEITRSFGLVLDGKAVFGDHEPYDRALRSTVGFDWRF